MKIKLGKALAAAALAIAMCAPSASWANCISWCEDQCDTCFLDCVAECDNMGANPNSCSPPCCGGC